jgi:hypothetical protein
VCLATVSSAPAQVGEYEGEMSVTRGLPAEVKAMKNCYTLSGSVAASTVTVVADNVPHSKRALCHFINHACGESANCDILWVCDEENNFLHRPFCKSVQSPPETRAFHLPPVHAKLAAVPVPYNL